MSSILHGQLFNRTRFLLPMFIRSMCVRNLLLNPFNGLVAAYLQFAWLEVEADIMHGD